MNAAMYTRSYRRSRKVKMSDCQSWFGSARSNRRSGCSRGPELEVASGSRPSSFRIRRTSLSDTPSASNRLSTSRIRRDPYCGCSRLTRTTASRRGSDLTGLGALERGRGISALTPPRRYAVTHPDKVVVPRPNVRATALAGVPRSTTSRAARIRNSAGYGRRSEPDRTYGTPEPRVDPLSPLSLITASLPGSPRQPRTKDSAR